MEQTYPSIFNDVIGPIMRGPSSSHCAAALRIGRLARDLMDGEIKEVHIRLDPKGSLATTHETQGSDMGLFGGLLGWEAHDARLIDAASALRGAKVTVKTEITDIGAAHPNTYELTLKNSRSSHRMTAISTGGGMIEVKDIDGVPVSIRGDFFETLVFFESGEDEIIAYLEQHTKADQIRLCSGDQAKFIEIKSQTFLDEEIKRDLLSMKNVTHIKQLSPVLPILSRANLSVPFITSEEMTTYNRNKGLSLWELATHYESARGNVTVDDVREKMRNIVNIMRDSITEGIQGTHYPDRILGHQSGHFKKHLDKRRLLDGGMLNLMTLYATAMMEVKSAMGLIVAAPTAGACGVLPGACLGAADFLNLPDDDVIKGLLSAGLIGVFISAHSTFAAEVCGCQAECGAGSGMAAAALVALAGGTLNQSLAAAAMALQNIFGMVCDPVANRVEVPCLGKNILAVGNALTSANMAIADFDPVIPLDEVIEAMDKVGKRLPHELRCTALGGLSVTKTSLNIKEKLVKPVDP